MYQLQQKKNIFFSSTLLLQIMTTDEPTKTCFYADDAVMYNRLNQATADIQTRLYKLKLSFKQFKFTLNAQKAKNSSRTLHIL